MADELDSVIAEMASLLKESDERRSLIARYREQARNFRDQANAEEERFNALRTRLRERVARLKELLDVPAQSPPAPPDEGGGPGAPVNDGPGAAR